MVADWFRKKTQDEAALVPAWTPDDVFSSRHYQRHNQRRQEHLATLELPVQGRSVLEVGAGIGDHTSFFLDRGCRVVTAEPRGANLEILRARFPDLRVEALDLDEPSGFDGEFFDIVYCYGTLYHLVRPAEAIEFMAAHCRDLLLLETCVTPGPGSALNLVAERAEDPSQGIRGGGCRPTRQWVFDHLAAAFPHVYVTVTQPWHEEFPIDWTTADSERGLTRSVFVASRTPLASALLTADIPMLQSRG